MNRRDLFAVVAVCTSILAFPGLSQGQNQLSQEAVALIEVECEDPDNGALSHPKGSGFVVHQDGYILTAFHVISCLDTQSKKQLQRNGEIGVRLGSPWELARTATVVERDEQADVAILKILGLHREYKPLPVCALRNPRPELTLIGAGFPEGSGYQPVAITFGNDEGALWAAAADFAGGMSGGPVAHQGVVVGIIKGGRAGVAAMRSIIPIYSKRRT